MSTWEIVSDADNTYRWEVKRNNVSSLRTTPIFIPSMSSDILIQASSTHSHPHPHDEEHAIDNNSCSVSSNSLFQTASGNKVTISSKGLFRAKTLLGFNEGTAGTNITPHNANKFHAFHQQSPHNANKSHKKMINSVSLPSPTTMIGRLKNDFESETVQPDRGAAGGVSVKQAPIKFQTAGGRCISISGDALQRARTLLGDPDLGDFFDRGQDSLFECVTPPPLVPQTTPESNRNHITKSFTCPLQPNRKMQLVKEVTNNRETYTTASSCETTDCNTPTPLLHQTTPQTNHNHMTNNRKGFTYPFQPSTQMGFSNKSRFRGSGNNLIMEFDDVGNECDYTQKNSNTCGQKPLCDRRNEVLDSRVHRSSSFNGVSSRMGSRGGMPLGRELVDISNTTNNTVHTINKTPTRGKRRLGGLHVTVSPFKKPRMSQKPVPGDRDVRDVPNDLCQLSFGASARKGKVSTRYPFQYPRMHIKEFFGVPPLQQRAHFRNPVRQVTSSNAEKYVFHDGPNDNGMGAEAFVYLLAQHGASLHLASNEWVFNHYKWIVWKLACYERCYPGRCAGKFLTVSNVLEELKYRYEKEVNHGHRSTIKKILEGDALPSSMMTLCISSIHSDHVLENETYFETQIGDQSREAVKVELTDGWYSVNATLDVPLSKQLAAGRLFVGQKLRIWGAGLCGWNGPVAPLEVSSTVSLLLHMNGTYRAHWAEQLGFCKVAGPPLAFRCIKSNGGLIPHTLAGITRVYPILYKERLSCGRSVVISERMESKMTELHNQRRSAVVDGIVSEHQERGGSRTYDYDDDSEGAKIYNMLETAAEPEYLMADMSPEQLLSFSAYKAKLNAIRQSEVESSIEKALKDAGLERREVTPFMRLRVVGLIHKTRQDKPKEGIVTIWNPTEKQRHELVEGEAYAISGLTPSVSDPDILHLQTRGSSTTWSPLSSKAREQFKPFFTSRKSISLSSLSDIPYSSEFDTVAFVVHVGEVYTSSQQRKQWVFVADGSIVYGLKSEKLIDNMLAICFSSPLIEYDSSPPVNYNLAGSTVGFCNLIKREKDHTNHIWVADANASSTYYLKFDSPHCCHLRNAANSVRRWAIDSSLKIEKVKEKVLSIIGNCKA